MDLIAELAAMGADPESVVDLRPGASEEARHLRYLDLVKPSAFGPHAVVERAAWPLAYVVDRRLDAGADVHALRRSLAWRSDAPYLVVIDPGVVRVLGISLSELAPDVSEERVVELDTPDVRNLLRRLDLAPDETLAPEGDAVHDRLFGLFRDVVNAVRGGTDERVSLDDAISLAGRALFLRVLFDRGIVRPEEIALGAGTERGALVSSPAALASTCTWLNRTFNGDLLPISLPLTEEALRAIPPPGFTELRNMVADTPSAQHNFGWGEVDFSQVPVGVLSQVYEHTAATWAPHARRTQSVYYTPRRIAEIMVREGLAGVGADGTPRHLLRVLDPSVGGGVFLVAAFRELVAAHWKATSVRPDTATLRGILREQLGGFDVQEPALRLTALSLYLAAIELDPHPDPVEKLRFPRLRPDVLRLTARGGGELKGFVAGSLGPDGDVEPSARWDVVVGNPPWTGADRSAATRFDDVVDQLRPLVAERLGPAAAAAFVVADRTPDVLFLWRAMQWAKPGGRIALVVNARLLFKQSDLGRLTREQVFRSLAITGVINGAALRRTDVWPDVLAPFCILFARNELPTDDHAFRYISPVSESTTNAQGRFRLDAASAIPVPLSNVLDRPETLKALFRGSWLDLGLLEQVQHGLSSGNLERFGEMISRLELASGQGFQVKGERNPAEFLQQRPLLRARSGTGLVVDPATLERFAHPWLHRPREEAIYAAPLVLVRKSPPQDAPGTRRRALLFRDGVLAYSESYFGTSTRGTPDPVGLAEYLVLALNSSLALWYVLVTSSEFGVERPAIHKADVDACPIVPPEHVLPRHRETIASFVARLERGEDAWDEVDAWFAKLVGLDSGAVEVIRDTLAVSLPYCGTVAFAEHAPSDATLDGFARKLRECLSPFYLGMDVQPVDTANSPWAAWVVGRRYGDVRLDPTPLVRAADDAGASQLVVQDRPGLGRVLVGVLRQERYVTQTRARLLALDLLREHGDALQGSEP